MLNCQYYQTVGVGQNLQDHIFTILQFISPMQEPLSMNVFDSVNPLKYIEVIYKVVILRILIIVKQEYILRPPYTDLRVATKRIMGYNLT